MKAIFCLTFIKDKKLKQIQDELYTKIEEARRLEKKRA